MHRRKAGILACSNPLDTGQKKSIESLSDFLETLGFDVVISPADMMYAEDRLSADPYRGEKKAELLMQMYADPEVEEIFDVSGGDMANELLDFLDFQVIRDSRARLWGYSDLTTLLNAVYAKTGKAGVLYQVRKTVSGDYQALQKERFSGWMAGTSDALFAPRVYRISGGTLEGTVVGGNMRCLLKLAGTDYFPDVTDRVLLLESLGGGMPQLTACLSQLRSMGVFGKISGLLLGTFTQLETQLADMQDSGAGNAVRGGNHTGFPFDLIRRFVPENLPIWKTDEIGHGDDSRAVVIGASYHLQS